MTLVNLPPFSPKTDFGGAAEFGDVDKVLFREGGVIKRPKRRSLGAAHALVDEAGEGVVVRPRVVKELDVRRRGVVGILDQLLGDYRRGRKGSEGRWLMCMIVYEREEEGVEGRRGEMLV